MRRFDKFQTNSKRKIILDQMSDIYTYRVLMWQANGIEKTFAKVSVINVSSHDYFNLDISELL